MILSTHIQKVKFHFHYNICTFQELRIASILFCGLPDLSGLHSTLQSQIHFFISHLIIISIHNLSHAVNFYSIPPLIFHCNLYTAKKYKGR